MPGSRACMHVRALLGRVGRAGLPGAFRCASPFPVAALSLFFVRPPPGLGRPTCCGFFFSFVRPPCLRRSVFSGPGCLGPGRLVRPPPPFFFLFFFFLSFVRPRCLRRSVFSGPGCLGPWRLVHPPLFFFLAFLFVFFCRPPPLFFFSSLVFYSLRFCFFFAALFVVLFCLFFVFSFLPVVRCRFVCLWLWGVLVCGAVGAAVCAALCVLPGAVWRACAWLGFHALLSGAVLRLVLLGCFCCVPLSRAAVFSAFFFFALFPAFPWWSLLFWSVWCVLLFGVALSHCVLVLASVALCRLVLCHAVVCFLVLWCVVSFVAVLGSRLASSAAVACCCALSVLGRGAVSSCCAACGPCAVVPCACFWVG